MLSDVLAANHNEANHDGKNRTTGKILSHISQTLKNSASTNAFNIYAEAVLVYSVYVTVCFETKPDATVYQKQDAADHDQIDDTLCMNEKFLRVH